MENFPRVDHRPVANRVLAVLAHTKLPAGCDPIALPFGKVLYEAGDLLRHVYFPIDCLVSLLTAVDGSHDREVGLVGREGMVGIALALGVTISPGRALVQGAGTAIRMTAARFRSEHGKHGPFHREVNQYIYELIVQTAQTAACNVSHPVEGRLARWLLMTRDRLGRDTFTLTHVLLGSMLGVRRGAVTNAAGALQRRKLIRYSRGEISILDGRQLEGAACQCYQLIKILGRKARPRTRRRSR